MGHFIFEYRNRAQIQRIAGVASIQRMDSTFAKDDILISIAQ